MTGMEDVLAAHAKEGSGMSSNSPDTCACGAKTYPERGDGDITERRNRAFAAHVAEALTAAGFGNLHDAWERCVTHVLRSCTYITSTTEEWRHARLISDLNEVKDANPYPAPKVSET